MLWEVERILDELYKDNKELPQILLMENVPQVIGTENVEFFNEWQLKLEKLGYKSYHSNLIATNYGIPQTRNRTFMISILGDYSYSFPQTIPLKYKLKNLLEDNVDEKYYLSEKMLEYIVKENENYTGNNNKSIINKNKASSLTTREGNSRCDSSNYISDLIDGECDLKPIREFGIYGNRQGGSVYSEKGMCPTLTTKSSLNWNILIKETTKKGYAIATDGDSINLEQPNSKTRRGRVGKGVSQTLLTNPQIATIQDLKIRKLTPKECFRLMGVKYEDYERIAKNQSDSSLYHLAGDSIVTTVLMAIFGELYGIDWKSKVDELLKDLSRK